VKPDSKMIQEFQNLLQEGKTIMEAKIRIKLGPIEVEFEGSEEFLKKDAYAGVKFPLKPELCFHGSPEKSFQSRRSYVSS
jgi:hypothetical protein